MSTVKTLVEQMVRSIVDDVENIKITEETSEKGTLFEITVSKEDVGKLIGKEGRIASALRTVAKAAGAKKGEKILVNVMNKPL